MQPSLKTMPFLSELSEAAIAAADAEASWFSLPAGDALFEAGDDTQALYFLASGSLAAFRRDVSGRPKLLGYIRAGEPVGEMALIAGEAHSASVYAIRDAELLRIPREAFDRLAAEHPGFLRQIARLTLARARQDRPHPASAEPKVYALIASSPTIDLRLRARALADNLAALGKTAAVLGEESADKTSAWFDAIERGHDYVLMTAAIGDTPWFRLCLRQADRLWVAARADARPSRPLLPEDPSPARQFRLVDVILLHHGGSRVAATSEEWRRACGAQRLFHWRGLDDADGRRLARTIAGTGAALVLSGGGARAFAHLGVLRALREAGLVFDVAAGTSMGGVVAACYAAGWPDDEIDQRLRKAFVETNPLGDYNLPVVGLSAGKRVAERLQEHFGEVLIEDLNIPFVCVSTDLVASAPVVHRSGLLRRALRATISLPGILPPVVTEDDKLLVDGAVLMNFPVEVAKEMHRGAIVGVDVARRNSINPGDFRDPPDFLGWVSRHGLQSAPPIVSLLMRTATLAVDPWAGRQGVDLLMLPDMPGIDLRDWKKFDLAVSAGYAAAVAALSAQPDLLESLRPAARPTGRPSEAGGHG